MDQSNYDNTQEIIKSKVMENAAAIITDTEFYRLSNSNNIFKCGINNIHTGLNQFVIEFIDQMNNFSKKVICSYPVIEQDVDTFVTMLLQDIYSKSGIFTLGSKHQEMEISAGIDKLRNSIRNYNRKIEQNFNTIERLENFDNTSDFQVFYIIKKNPSNIFKKEAIYVYGFNADDNKLICKSNNKDIKISAELNQFGSCDFSYKYRNYNLTDDNILKISNDENKINNYLKKLLEQIKKDLE